MRSMLISLTLTASLFSAIPLFKTSAMRDGNFSIPQNGEKSLVDVISPAGKTPVLRLSVKAMEKPWNANFIMQSDKKPKAGEYIVTAGYIRSVGGSGKVRIQFIGKPSPGFGSDLDAGPEWKPFRFEKMTEKDAESARIECIAGYQEQTVELAGICAVSFSSAEEAKGLPTHDIIKIAFAGIKSGDMRVNTNPKGPYGYQPPMASVDFPPSTVPEQDVLVTADTVRTWKLPPQAAEYGISNSVDFDISINGVPFPVYTSLVNPKREVKCTPDSAPPEGQTVLSWSSFESDAPVTVDITVKRDFTSVAVKPLIQKHMPQINGRRIRLTLAPQQKVVLEFDGSLERCLALFPNPRHTPPSKDTPGLTWFGPGIHPVGHRLLKSDETIYIAGGAIVSGTFFGESVINVRIFGPGIIDGSKMEHKISLGIELRRCADVVLDGFIFRDSPHWTIVPRVSTNITCHNLKIMNWRGNGDGIDPCNTRDVWISNCFIWSSDDVMSPKGCVWFGMSEAATVPLENLFVSNVLGYNHAGYMVRIGDETVAPTMSNLIFRDLHVNVRGEPIGLINCDRAVQTDILVENLNIERYHGYFLDLQIYKGRYTFDKDLRGKIENILFRNVRMLGKEAGAGGARFLGFDTDHKVRNVTVEGYIDGKGNEVKEIRKQDETNAFTENIRFIPLGEK